LPAVGGVVSSPRYETAYCPICCVRTLQRFRVYNRKGGIQETVTDCTRCARYTHRSRTVTGVDVELTDIQEGSWPTAETSA
jgi:hypothetical protein